MLAALERGASVAEAAAEVRISENTVRAWIRRGRLDPEGRFGPTAQAFDRRRTLLARPMSCSLPDRVELLSLLTEQARKGSVRAIELLLRETPADSSAAVADDEHWRRLMVVPREAS